MKIKKYLYIGIGCIGLALGAIGALIPLLPSFPFLLIAVICFGKSSERLHTRFIGTKLYKNNLESYMMGKGMTRKAKINVMCFITLTMTLGFIMMKKVPVGRIVLAIVWLFHMAYFSLKIKTITEEE